MAQRDGEQERLGGEAEGRDLPQQRGVGRVLGSVHAQQRYQLVGRAGVSFGWSGMTFPACYPRH